ncbi:hypothetical protein C9374_005248 [Naegleria lovaniensis]|uniref:Plasmid pRiA4b Orf3-like domain-containing protein n=1 Tax=Naegleria lovaniensis TaxID=51637 RepID=A0AA88KK83_NAELO|nr:uncharacterized protein C9374_005248 [Naegleria lovaniensis]KAG2382668.1 hypothetical protein C9374_005248 [Naegleria lovaniensis]
MKRTNSKSARPSTKSSSSLSAEDNALLEELAREIERKRQRQMKRLLEREEEDEDHYDDDDDDDDVFHITRVTTELPNKKIKQQTYYHDGEDEFNRFMAQMTSSRASSSNNNATTASSSSSITSRASTTTATTTTAPTTGIYDHMGRPATQEDLDSLLENPRQAFRVLYQVKAVVQGSKKEIYREFVISATILFKNLHELLVLLFGWNEVSNYRFTGTLNGDAVTIAKRASKNNVSAASTKFHQVCPNIGDQCVWIPEGGKDIRVTLTVEVINTSGHLESTPRCVGLLNKIGFADGKEGVMQETDTNLDRVNSKLKHKRFAANSSNNKVGKQGIKLRVRNDTTASEFKSMENKVFRQKLLTRPFMH